LGPCEGEEEGMWLAKVLLWAMKEEDEDEGGLTIVP
jgi:hypothetical protein